MPDRLPLGEINPNITPPSRKKMGKKLTPIANRRYTATKPIKRVERSYGRQRQVEVLLYLEHHRYPIYPGQRLQQRAGDTPLDPANGLRRPTLREAAAHFKIPFTTVATWYLTSRNNKPMTRLLPLDGSSGRPRPFSLPNIPTPSSLAILQPTSSDSLQAGSVASLHDGTFHTAGLQNKPQNCLPSTLLSSPASSTSTDGLVSPHLPASPLVGSNFHPTASSTSTRPPYPLNTSMGQRGQPEGPILWLARPTVVAG
ncbi:uncharacterized protein LY79DRAFT_662219, partial [Colletotrichum navitas]